MVYADPEGPYIKLLAPFLAKKKRLAADEWGTDLSTVQHVFQPLEDWLEEEVPGIKQRYPPVSRLCLTRASSLPFRSLIFLSPSSSRLHHPSRCGTPPPTSAGS